MSLELSPKDILYEFSVDDDVRNNDLGYIPEYDQVYKKIKSALEINDSGYNVYLIDEFSKDKLENIISFVEKTFETRDRPMDICYVVSDDPKRPQVLFLPNGGGTNLKEILVELQNSYSESIFNFYNSSSNKDKEFIIDNMQKKRNLLIGKLEDMAEEYGFEIKITQGGFVFIPLKEGEAMSEKDYDDLENQKKDDILDKVGKLKENAEEILEELKDMELEELDKIKELMGKHFESSFKEIKEEYSEVFADNSEVVVYLNNICSEIEKNIIDNYSINYEEDEEKINEIIYKYDVNVIVDNSENEKPQVLYEEDPSIISLLGNMEYENHNNVYTTDASMINAGSMLKANEGCLIIRANNLFANSQAYYYLKKTLISEKVNLDYNRGYLELLSLSSLKPEPVKVKVKVILIGDYETYDVLYNYDEDFKNIFKIRAEYEPVVNIDKNTKRALINSVSKACTKDELKPLSSEALVEIAKFLSRKAENKNKLYFDDSEINKLLKLSNNKVLNENRDKIEAEDIRSVAYLEEVIQKELLENYKDKRILINVNGSTLGQINGLSVIDTGYFSFGKPIRITCSCYKGEGNIIDVQKESNLSGSIHSKSINILKGYINRLSNSYARIPVDFHLSFEQLYGKIDGDSASVAEIICMISALSKIPIKQNIAVTGSVNQFGEVQPIGGVNEKIEGFFNICKVLDSTMDKGVLIPYSNRNDLVLNSFVEEEIKKGSFHIYTMNTVEDAIEILMQTDKIKLVDVMNTINKELKKYSSKR
ncbi:AAA family ATPase [Clostridium sp. YIM B02515]|uniref:endopeptidase La n=1 Tax=Clostridium rhizosphaerae TaxID=2803861 RepID=A0ABS1TF86_9CLOT|nr:AAA family ATPase [Clostridium rhizosphaerae]MBL4937960.1 AAA family ATPase [Clostridium rhizosphaerae]